MRVDLGDPFRQMRDQPPKPRLGHGAAPGEPENLIRSGEASPLHMFALKARSDGECRKMRTGRLDLRQNCAGLEWRANGHDAKYRPPDREFRT